AEGGVKMTRSSAILLGVSVLSAVAVACSGGPPHAIGSVEEAEEAVPEGCRSDDDCRPGRICMWYMPVGSTRYKRCFDTLYRTCQCANCHTSVELPSFRVPNGGQWLPLAALALHPPPPTPPPKPLCDYSAGAL